ncbi:MAG: hypothetical protein IJH91_03280 [Mogibacterium sp.]|nr:hypothetical protein [Mogibacterium sp.]
MKKLVLCVGVVAAAVSAYKYLEKNGLPALGNLTMKLPVQPKYDMYDLVDKVLSYVKLP